MAEAAVASAADGKVNGAAARNPRPHKFMYKDALNPEDVVEVPFEQECCFKACSSQRHWGVFAAAKDNSLYCRKHRGERENKKTDLAETHDEPLIPWSHAATHSRDAAQRDVALQVSSAWLPAGGPVRRVRDA